MGAGVGTRVERVGSADNGERRSQLSQFLIDHPGGDTDGRGVEQGVPVGPVPPFGEMVTGCLQEWVQFVPAGVAAGGQGLADTGRPVAQADVVTADRVGELGEPAVLLGDDEVSVVGRRLTAGGSASGRAASASAPSWPAARPGSPCGLTPPGSA